MWRGRWQDSVQELRSRREVVVTSLCDDPIKAPAREVLFTSNALLTLPPRGKPAGQLHLHPDMAEKLAAVADETQRYWYDHPVQMGTAPAQNEILYGLKGLTDMLRFERDRGNASDQDKLEVVLSASVTHAGLKALAREYLENEVADAEGVEGLNVYVFTEKDTSALVDEFLLPAAECFGVDVPDPATLRAVFGVDGAYGRHYSFLKAVAGLWHVAVNPAIRATFKIDLDQVFPQETLVRETGRSAFESFCTPLWGADGTDAENEPVHLGMIAGSLVNQSDISKGLFTPDVELPRGPLPPDRWVFPSVVPQALSTEAEMMTRYGDGGADGRRSCLSRIHVTGGTVGLRVSCLRRYRPFTLSCIGRAEDQSYIMSVLFEHGPPYLRYLHASGLVMRHDKHGFAGEAIEAAAAGKAAGDYERMLLFSEYARALPWSLEETRRVLDPFTGCFIRDMPWTTAVLCLALKVLDTEGESAGDGAAGQAGELLRVAVARLSDFDEKSVRSPGWVKRIYEEEKSAWECYYSILDKVEEGKQNGSADALRLIERVQAIVESTRVHG